MIDRLDNYIAGLFTSSMATVGGFWGWIIDSGLAGQIIMAFVVGAMGGLTSLVGIYFKHKLDLKKELVLRAMEKGVTNPEEVRKLL